MSKILIEQSTINQAINDFDDIQNALIEKGIDVSSDVPTNEYGDKIRSISSEIIQKDVWERPADRPPIPTISEDEQVIYWLFGVQKNGPNDFAIGMTVSSGQYIIEWGDGTQNNYSNVSKVEHLFDYDSVIGDPNQDGYKWVWIKAYPATSNFTSITIDKRHTLRPSGSSSNIFIPQVFEWYMRAPYITTIQFSNTIYTRYMLLDTFEYYGSNLMKSFSYFLCNSRNLKNITIDTSNGTNFSYFLQYCSSFNQLLNIDTSNGTDFSYFLQGCSSFNNALYIDTRKGTNFNYFLQGCSSFNQPLYIDTSNGTGFSSFLSNCSSFNKLLNIDTTKGTSFTSFISNCSLFTGPLTIDMSSTTTAIGSLFASCLSLKSVHLKNIGLIHTTFSVLNSNFDVDALVSLFIDLPDRNGTTSGKITITNSFGASRLTEEQRKIATDKNWTVET